MIALSLTFVFTLTFLYLSIFVNIVFLFGLLISLMVFILVTMRINYKKIAKLVEKQSKIENKEIEIAENHPIIKSARSRLSK